VPFQLELPDIGEGVVEAEVQHWLVAPGDLVEEDQPLVEVMTDKATVVIPSPRRGRVLRLLWKEGEVARVHAPLVELDTGDAEAPAASDAPAVNPSSRPAPPRSGGEGEGRGDQPPRAVMGKALATPAVRARARELGLAIDEVHGTGPGGRVTKEDLEGARGRRNGHAAATPGSPEAPEREKVQEKVQDQERARARTPAGAVSEERIPLRGIRKRIAENMARSKRTAAHFTFVEQCDATELVRARDRMAEAARAEGVKLTFLPFILKAAVAALRAHPRLNATMDEERGELVLHRRFDLGVAAATGEGLVVPVVRDVAGKTILDLAREIDRLASAARDGKLRPEDVGRSTFTVTSLGALGGLFATPVLNHPEVGILGIHRIRPTPVVRDGAVAVRDVMHVSLTSDHRVIDGHEAAAFAYEVIRLLEEPALLFMRLA
jgi:pyruvate dehydrogenase E2 component (dihydrolipoamide acetyltransferase)